MKNQSQMPIMNNPNNVPQNTSVVICPLYLLNLNFPPIFSTSTSLLQIKKKGYTMVCKSFIIEYSHEILFCSIEFNTTCKDDSAKGPLPGPSYPIIKPALPHPTSPTAYQTPSHDLLPIYLSISLPTTRQETVYLPPYPTTLPSPLASRLWPEIGIIGWIPIFPPCASQLSLQLANSRFVFVGGI